MPICKTKTLFVVGFITCLFLWSCMPSDSSSGSSSSSSKISLEVVTASSNSTSSTSAQSTTTKLVPMASTTDTALGQATTSQLSSLKYYIYDISICQDMTISGTSFSNATSCIAVYTGDTSADYDTYLAADARSDTTNYIDLMDSTSRAKLKNDTELTSSHVGEYKYGKINFYRPLKVTASITLNDNTTTLYTKDGTVVVESGTGLDTTYTNQVTNMNTASAEEAIVVLSNGGSWFKFQNPFTLTSDDITNGTEFKMKLAFNPEGVIKGFEYYGTKTGKTIQDTGTSYVISVPILGFTPVIHRSTETVKKESYLLSYTGSAVSPFDISLGLYYISEDSAKTIYAVDASIQFNSSTKKTNSESYDIHQVFSLQTNSDGTLGFLSYESKAFINNFSRGSTAGDTGTANLQCDQTCYITNSSGSFLSESLSLTTTLVSIDTVQ